MSGISPCRWPRASWGPGRSDTGTAVIGDCKSGDGVLGRSVSAAGVAGHSATGTGVDGRSKSASGVSVISGTGVGASGESDSSGGVAGHSKKASGVSGESDGDNGVLGISKAESKAGVFGYSNVDGSIDKPGIGTVGFTDGIAGIGVLGNAPRRGTGVVANGTWGLTAHGTVGPGVQAYSDGEHGVTGFAARGGFAGVAGTNDEGFGVAGYSASGTGVYGESGSGSLHPGVHGKANNPPSFKDSWAGVFGESDNGIGVLARSAKATAFAATSSNSFAMLASGDTAASFLGIVSVDGPTVLANSVTAAPPLSVLGDTNGAASFGSDEGNTIHATVLQLGIAVHAVAANPGAPSTYAGMFDGDVNVNGTFRKTSSHFLIDHPLEPAEKYLEHCAVESSEMNTFYDGIATLDTDGTATVRLPTWFEPLNRDLRYQLTPLGGAAPDLHIAQEVHDGHFVIAGGQPRMRVCWQVSGRRADAWAEAPAARRTRQACRRAWGLSLSRITWRAARPAHSPRPGAERARPCQGGVSGDTRADRCRAGGTKAHAFSASVAARRSPNTPSSRRYSGTTMTRSLMLLP